MEFPRLKFDYEYDERLAFEAESRGHLGGITVELADGSKHRVFFYDRIRLTQDLEAHNRQGRPFVAEKGMIVLTRITIENIQKAVTQLAKEGFFS